MATVAEVWTVLIVILAMMEMEPVASAAHAVASENGTGSSLSAGSLLLIIFCCGLAVYFAFGMLFRKFIGGATGYEVVPNYDFWSDLPLLIKDGVRYTCSGFRSEVVYERI